MRVLVPYDARDPKTRLSPVFDAAERAALARRMLEDVLEVLERAGHDPTVLATAEVDALDVESVVDERPLSEAVNRQLERDGPLAVVMADLPLLTVETAERLFDREGDVVIAPGLGGGTNALVVRHPSFRVDYHGVSYRDHVAHATELGATVSTVYSFRLAVDVDDPDDLVEVLLHGENATTEWLRNAGASLEETETRTRLSRSTDSR